MVVVLETMLSSTKLWSAACKVSLTLTDVLEVNLCLLAIVMLLAKCSSNIECTALQNFCLSNKLFWLDAELTSDENYTFHSDTDNLFSTSCNGQVLSSVCICYLFYYAIELDRSVA